MNERVVVIGIISAIALFATRFRGFENKLPLFKRQVHTDVFSFQNCTHAFKGGKHDFFIISVFFFALCFLCALQERGRTMRTNSKKDTTKAPLTAWPACGASCLGNCGVSCAELGPSLLAFLSFLEKLVLDSFFYNTTFPVSFPTLRKLFTWCVTSPLHSRV